jgi:hypothetical protein
MQWLASAQEHALTAEELLLEGDREECAQWLKLATFRLEYAAQAARKAL